MSKLLNTSAYLYIYRYKVYIEVWWSQLTLSNHRRKGCFFDFVSSSRVWSLSAPSTSLILSLCKFSIWFLCYIFCFDFLKDADFRFGCVKKLGFCVAISFIFLISFCFYRFPETKMNKGSSFKLDNDFG